MNIWVKTLPVLLLLNLAFPSIVEAWPGCCSHHQGVCGCGCCDGSPLSSTCAPHYPECNGSAPIEVIPTIKPVIIIPTRVPPTRRPTLIPTKKLTLTLTPTIELSPTETLSPTPYLPTQTPSSKVANTKVSFNQSWFARFFSWLFKSNLQ